MKKIIILIIVIFVFLLILGGAFLWQERNKLMGENIIRFEPPENYAIKETLEGKIVEDKKAGLSFKIPTDWRVMVSEYKKGEGIVEIFSPGADFYPNTGIIKKGCGIAVSTEYKSKEEIGMIVDLIKSIKENRINSGAQPNKTVIEVDSFSALKSLIFNKPEMGQGFKIEVPVAEDRAYVFNTFVPPEEEKCPSEFDKFLATVSIIQ